MPSSTFSSSRLALAALVLLLTLAVSEGPYVARDGLAPPPEVFFHPGRSSAAILAARRAEAVYTIGDSHIMADVVPGIVAGRLGLECFNLPVAGHHPALGLAWLEAAGIEPAMVVIDVSPMRLGEAVDDPLETRRLVTYLDGPADLEAARDVGAYELSVQLGRLFPSSAHPLRPAALGRAAGHLAGLRIDAFVYEFYGLPVRLEVSASAGFSNIVAVEYPAGCGPASRQDALDRARRLIAFHSRFGDVYLERLERALDRWTGRATRFVLTRAPLEAPLREADLALNGPFYTRLFDAARARRIPIYDYPSFDRASDFVDGHHLWAEAAARFSAELALDLAAARAMDPVRAAEALALALATADPGEAIGLLTEAIARDPYLADARNARGFARLRLGDAAGAIDDFTAALTIEPTDPSPLVNRAQALLEIGQGPAAVADLERALAIAGGDWPHRRRVEALLEAARRRR